MGMLDWVRRRLGPVAPKLTNGAPISNAKPLHQQFQRIGGALTPADVSYILREADSGVPARFVDLANESRQRDGHLQSVLYTRESAAALVDLEFIQPEDASPKEIEAVDLCRRIRDDFRNWPTLIEHLNGSFFGHATVELLPWQKDRLANLVPRECKPLHPRDFIFTNDTGALRYARHASDRTGVDLLADFPGRIVQVQRRVNGDVPAREGIARVLIWPALFRNWDLRDWIALGEVGWKPRTWAYYSPGTQTEDQEDLLRRIEFIAERGLGVFEKGVELNIQWPQGSGAGSGAGVHRELYDTMGREMSKCALGQTTSVEVGPNGSRADTAARDVVRRDIRECDCRAIAAALRYHMFGPAVAINLGADVRPPVPWFATDDATDQLSFGKAMLALRQAGLRIPAKWVRDEVGMPEPYEGEELLEVEVVTDGDEEEDPAAPDEGDEGEGQDKKAA